MNMLLFLSTRLSFLLVSACSAVPTFLEKYAVNESEALCISLGTCRGVNVVSWNPPLSFSPPQLRPSPPISITSSLVISATPTTSPAASLGVDLYLYGCSSDQEVMMKEAWAGAAKLADAHAKWRPPGLWYKSAYQAAQAMYLGDDSKHDVSWFGTGPLRHSSGSISSLMQTCLNIIT